jgi:hypothetical protein
MTPPPLFVRRKFGADQCDECAAHGFAPPHFYGDGVATERASRGKMWWGESKILRISKEVVG